ncbi:ShK domain-like family protein [Brugia pahangi]
MVWMFFIFITVTFLCTCMDLVTHSQPSSCPHLAHLCNNSLYCELMTKQCPKICGPCSENVTSDIYGNLMIQEYAKPCHQSC